MSFQENNRNSGKANKVMIYVCGHDLTVTFSLVKHQDGLVVKIIEAVNSATGKDTGLSDERLIEEVLSEIKSHNLLTFNYSEETE